MTTDKTFLVVGGTGKTGRRVADRLRARGHAVRAVSRATEPPFDWYDETTWGAVLDVPVEAAYLTFQPDLALPGAAERIRAFSTLAAAKGVHRLVLLSGRGEPETEPSERAVRESGVDWTVVRCAWFAQNFSEGFLLPLVMAGDFTVPAGEVGEPFVDLDDVADVVVEALVAPGHAGEEYDLTGPRLLTFADAAAEIAAVSGRAVRYRPGSPEMFAASLDLPAEAAMPLAELFERVLDGRNEFVTGDVERVLGRPARDFADYAKAAADAWSR
ncbi:MAG TPA: NmrA family transcriptional regulator [Actinophytocola sp.]|jgi:uncharacterized protein YbjT (DUF2867 family)|uniref:NmrA family transcriptional regulator n=1 Tax=Actinophytocola sp. TaxID=1872138 RepID=UPI002F91C2D3